MTTSIWCARYRRSENWPSRTEVNQALASLGDSLAPDCVAVPSHGPDVCPVCRGYRDETDDVCDSCAVCRDGLGAVCPVVPMSLYAKPSAMRERLRNYKDSDDAPERRRLSKEVAALIQRFFVQHGAALADRFGSWDTVCIVPSTDRQLPHPLVRALTDHDAVSCGPLAPVLRRAQGQIAHRKPNCEAFEPITRVDGRSVLLLDDVFTTGARSQSAACALTDAGAVVPAIVVVARRINPGWRPEVEEWWKRQLAIPFSWSARSFDGDR